jgi:alkanesulfonate monooxygenase SsuD/methylene tetrahydromethanopterin reductase-like flavin-dependent oxidoreductase (luciferase family)
MAAFKVEKILNWGVAYSPEMQTGGKPRPRWDTARAQVREAEELGYDAVVGAETQHDPFLMMALAAQEPSRLQLVTGIALAFTKSPVATAYIAWDLQTMSEGRFVLGLGTQVKGRVTRPLRNAVVQTGAADEGLRRRDARLLEHLADRCTLPLPQ